MTAAIGTEAGALGLATLGRVRKNTFETLQALGAPTAESVKEAAGLAHRSEGALRALKPGHFSVGLTPAQGTRAAEDAAAAASDLAATGNQLTTLSNRMQRLGAANPVDAGFDETAFGRPLRSAMTHLQEVQLRVSKHLPSDEMHQLPTEAAPSARPSWASDDFLDEVGPLAQTRTQRLHEMPYGVPKGFQINRLTPGEKLDLEKLDPDTTYVWAMDAKGGFIYAPETQPGFGVSTAHPDGRMLKHGDLMPADTGLHRAPARGGGMLKVARHDDGTLDLAKDGKPMWQLDNNSSYTFVRGQWDWKGWEGNSQEAYTVGKALNDDNIIAVRAMLVRGGADAKHLEASNFLNFALDSPEHPQWVSSVVRDFSHDAVWTVSNVIKLSEKLPPRFVNWVKAHKPGHGGGAAAA